MEHDPEARFARVVDEAFAFLADFGFRAISDPHDMRAFRRSWTDGRTTLECAGIHWGSDASTTIGAADGEQVALWSVIAAIDPLRVRVAAGQDAQIEEDARVLRELAMHVLRGDHTVLAPLVAAAQRRLDAFYAEQQAEEEALLADGWVETDLGLCRPDHPSYVRVRRRPGGPADS